MAQCFNQDIVFGDIFCLLRFYLGFYLSLSKMEFLYKSYFAQIYTLIILFQTVIKFAIKAGAVRRTRATGMYAHLFDNGFAYFVRKQSKKDCLRKVN